MQSSRWTSIGREILFSARTELYMNLPFLDSALAALPAADGYEMCIRDRRCTVTSVRPWSL